MDTFIEQLTNIEQEFFAEVNEQDLTADFDSYTISIRNGYLVMRIECFDKDDDTVVITQEIEQHNGELLALRTHYEY
ncbi:MAG: hypothetical protein NC131_07345 [Roseburia sp.]|nr:hypothetical protein [Roseburia sp.]